MGLVAADAEDIFDLNIHTLIREGNGSMRKPTVLWYVGVICDWIVRACVDLVTMEEVAEETDCETW